jgi:hypothetical protein
MYRFWRGPILGPTVSHAWSSYATCLFLEFSRLEEGEKFTDQRGWIRRYQPSGEWTITSMERWPAWKILLSGRALASWTSCRRARLRALRLLVGRRLITVEIDPASNATRLTFTKGVGLETKTDLQRLRREPHWLMRGPTTDPDNWPSIVLKPWSSNGRVFR